MNVLGAANQAAPPWGKVAIAVLVIVCILCCCSMFMKGGSSPQPDAIVANTPSPRDSSKKRTHEYSSPASHHTEKMSSDTPSPTLMVDGKLMSEHPAHNYNAKHDSRHSSSDNM
jgi:hypothetical protein